MPAYPADIFSVIIVIFGAVLLVREYEIIPWVRWYFYSPNILQDLLVEDEDSYNRSSDNAFVELKRYRVGVKHAAVIPDLSLKVIAINPPVPGLSLPLELTQHGRDRLTPYSRQEYIRQHYFLLNKYRINHQQIISQMFVGSREIVLPPASYKFEVTASGEADWGTRTAWFSYDGLNF